MKFKYIYINIFFVFPMGCAFTSTRPMQKNLENRQFIDDVEMIVPYNCLSGKKWNWEYLHGRELRDVLKIKMPSPASVSPKEPSISVLERCTGKTVIFIPALSAKLHSTIYGSLYNEERPEHYNDATSVGDYLQTASTMTTEFGTLAPENDNETYYITAIIMTKRHILIIALPDGKIYSPEGDP